MLSASSFSLDLVLYLQQWSPSPMLDATAVFVTLCGDPKLVFLYLAPLVYWLHHERSVGLDVLIGMLLSDWTNALLKWPARGDRPYWHSDLVKEFSVTCESGYGMPSGHVMVSSTVAYILVSHTARRYRSAARAFAILFVTAVAITRMYVGAHFIGQVTLGAVAGVTTGWFVITYQLSQKLTAHLRALLQQHASRRSGAGYWRTVCFEAFASSAFLVLVPVVEFFVLSLWTDPLHSLTLAREGCEATRMAAALSLASADEQAQFQLDRGPFMGVMRDAGVVLGGMLAWAAVLAWKIDTRTSGAPTANHNHGDEGIALLGTPSADVTPVDNLDAAAARFLGMTLSRWHDLLRLLLRGVIGLWSAYFFQQLLSLLFVIPPLSLLAPMMPLVFTYGKNYLLFAGITFHFLVLAPVLMRLIERGPDHRSFLDADISASGALAAHRLAPSERRRVVGLVIAHPDDECMFFTPTLGHVVSRGHTLAILCLSAGNAAGLGETRARELVASARLLQVDPQHVRIIQDEIRLADGMRTHWSESDVEQHVAAFVRDYHIDTLLTFDDGGISGHPNHIDTFRGVRAFLSHQPLAAFSSVVGYSLLSTPIWRKYVGVGDLAYSRLEEWLHQRASDERVSSSFFLVVSSQPLLTYHCMKAHASQLVWFRRLFIIFSRYTYVNTLGRIEAPKVPAAASR